MDYHVFILSRIREAYDSGDSTEQAITHGIKTTAGVITSAALVMVCVFSVFAVLWFLIFKQIGVGLAAAILIDATIIRAVLLPATMKLLGDWNWYLPSWLEWLPHLEHGGRSTGSTYPLRRFPRRERSSRPGRRRAGPHRRVGPRRPRSPTWRGGRSAVVALHVADDNFLQPQPGTSAADHLVSGLVPLAVLALAAWAYPRLRAGFRASDRADLGLFGIVAGVEAAYYTARERPPATTSPASCRSWPASC